MSFLQLRARIQQAAFVNDVVPLDDTVRQMAGQFLRYRARYTGASASSSLFNCLDPPVDIRTGVSETPGWSSGDVGQKAGPPLVVSSLTGPHLKIALQITIVDCRLKPVGTGMRYQWLTLAALSWPAAAVAQAEDCPLPPDGNDISVFVEIPEYSLSHALSAAELTAQFGHLFPDDARVDGIADIGEAYAEGEYQVVEWGWQDDPLGVGCFALESGVTFWYEAPIVLYVASDYPQGTTCYGAILRHEQEHYEITRELAETFGRRLKRALENDPKIAKTWNPVRFYSAEEFEQVQHLSTQRAARVINGFLRRLNDDMEALHRRLDSTLSYERTYAKCTE